MIVRSRSTPASAGDEERGGNRHQDRGADVFGIAQLHDVGGVGAEHHQLAVRHVDDAHDAEGDRQADRDQHEHRSEAQAEEQRLDARVEPARADRSLAPRRRPRAGPPASRSTKVPSVGLLEQRGEPVAHFRPQAARPACAIASSRACGIAAVERREREPGLDLRPSRRHRSRRRRAARSSAMLASSSERSISVTASSRTAASGLDSAKRATAVLSTLRRRLFVPILVSSSRGAGPASSSDTGSTSSRAARLSSADLTMKTPLIASGGRTDDLREAR